MNLNNFQNFIVAGHLNADRNSDGYHLGAFSMCCCLCFYICYSLRIYTKTNNTKNVFPVVILPSILKLKTLWRIVSISHLKYI